MSIKKPIGLQLLKGLGLTQNALGQILDQWISLLQESKHDVIRLYV